MKKPPLILISGSTASKGVEFGDASLSLSMNYALAIRAAAGLPWLLPCVPERELVAEAVSRSDGVMLTGGDDVQPSLYSAKLPPVIEKTIHAAAPERDLFELLLIDEVFRQRKPLLAICRGHQILNVALGGTLFADIASQKPKAFDHRRTDKRSEIVHEVQLTPGSLLAKITIGQKLGVNSTHHQAVARVAAPLRVTARSEDGIIEALELKPGGSHWLPLLVSVQFHPE